MSRLVIAHDAEECECCEVSLALKAQRDELLAVLKECVDVLDLSDPNGARAATIEAPEDALILDLCERIGFGAVMDSAARQWRARDQIGAHTAGATAATVRRALKLACAAIAKAEGER